MASSNEPIVLLKLDSTNILDSTEISDVRLNPMGEVKDDVDIEDVDVEDIDDDTAFLTENNFLEGLDTNIKEISSFQESQNAQSNSYENNNINLWQETQKLREKYSDRILFKKNPSGTTTAIFNLKPTYYIDSNGDQQQIDTTITTITKTRNSQTTDLINDNFNFNCVKNNLLTYFNDNYMPKNDDSLVSITKSGHQYPITWQPIKLSLGSEEEDNLEMAKKLESNLQLTSSIVFENTITYNNIYPGCDDRYSVMPNKLKHDLILNKFPFDLIRSESIITSSLNIRNKKTLNYYGVLTLPASIKPSIGKEIKTESFETDKPIILRDIITGEEIYQISTPVVYEQSSPNNRIICNYEVVPLENSWARILVILKVDYSWLIDEKRTFPVVIDPNIKIPDWDKGEMGYDTYLVKGNETEPDWTDLNFGADKELKVSIAGPSIFSKENLLHRTILKFPAISSIESYANILEAKLQLLCTNTGNMSITVYRLFDNWIEGTGTDAEPSSEGATWNHSGYNMWLGGNYEGAHVDPYATLYVGNPNFYRWNIINIVRAWVSDPIKYPNNGLILTGTDNEDIIKTFHSSEVSNFDSRPRLEIEYNTPPMHTGLETISVYEGTEKIINRTDVFFDPDMDVANDPEEQIFYEIWNGTAWTDNGINQSIKGNYSAWLKENDRIYINTYETSEEFGQDVLKVHIKDSASTKWKVLEITVNVIETNDPPIIDAIAGYDILEDDEFILLDSTEDITRRIQINVTDPDNLDYIEVSKPKHGMHGDLDFDWEREKTNRFTISEYGEITFNPDNSLVGEFHMNVTVYDTVWQKVGKRYKKFRLSNDSIELIFSIENSNDKPDKPRILEPKTNSEFTTEDTITFRATCTDDDLLIPNSNENLIYKWIIGDDTPLGQGQTLKQKVSKGTHLITLRVEDFEKAFTEVNITIYVRNRATIDALNCSNYFVDEPEDVLIFYYESTDKGEEDFKVERGVSIQANIYNIDITELTSQRFRQYLLVNLTINQNISSILEAENYVYEFLIYLVKPTHREEVIPLEGIRYLGKRYDDLYEPLDYYAKLKFDNKYYKNNGLGDFKITNRGKTLAFKSHLGDLEAGEESRAKLRSDFSIFAVVKTEIKQHPAGYFEHIICYDSAGYGSEQAPFPKQSKKISNMGDDEGNLAFILSTIVIAVIIIIILIGFFLLRREAKEEKATAKILFDTTKPSIGAKGKGAAPTPMPGFPPRPFVPPGMPMTMPPISRMPGTAPPGKIPGPYIPLFPPPFMHPGRPGMPMLPPPRFPGPGFGPGKISPVTPPATGKSKKGKKRKKR